jgi:hypothetical protein
MLKAFQNKRVKKDEIGKIRVAGGSTEKRPFLPLGGGGEKKKKRRRGSKKDSSLPTSPENDKDFRVIVSNTAYRSQVADDRIKTLVEPSPIKSVDSCNGKRQKLMAILGDITIEDFFRKYAGCDIVDDFIVRTTLIVEGEKVAITPPINDMRNSKVVSTVCTIVPDMMLKIIALIMSIQQDHSPISPTFHKERLESLLINREKPKTNELSMMIEMLEWCWTNSTEALNTERLFKCGFHFKNARGECMRVDTRSVAVILNYALKCDFRHLNNVSPPSQMEAPPPPTTTTITPIVEPQLPFKVSPEIEERTKNVFIAVKLEMTSVTRDNDDVTEETLKNRAILKMLGNATPQYTSDAMKDSKILEMFSGFRATHTKQKGGRKPTKKQTTAEEREIDNINDALSQGSHDLVTMKDLGVTVTRVHPTGVNGTTSGSRIIFSAPFICSNLWKKCDDCLCVKETWLWPPHKTQVISSVKKHMEPIPPPTSSLPPPPPQSSPAQKNSKKRKPHKSQKKSHKKVTENAPKKKKLSTPPPEQPCVPNSDIPQKLMNALSRDMPWITPPVCKEFLSIRESMLKLMSASRWDEIREYVYSRVYQDSLEKEAIALLERNPEQDFRLFSAYQEDAEKLFSPLESLEPGFLEKCRGNIWKSSLKFALEDDNDDDGVLPKLKNASPASKATINASMMRIISFLICNALKDFRLYDTTGYLKRDVEHAKHVLMDIIYPDKYTPPTHDEKEVKKKVDSLEDMFASFDDDDEVTTTVEAKEPYIGLLSDEKWPYYALPLIPSTLSHGDTPMETSDRIRVALLRHIFPSIHNLYTTTPKYAKREEGMRGYSIESGLHARVWLLEETLMCSTRVFWFFMVTMDFIIDCDHSGPLLDPLGIMSELRMKFIF